MRSPMTLTFRNIDRSGELEAHARELGDRLQRFGERITQCHISLEGPPYLVKIALTVPGAQIHADNLPVNGAGHADIHFAMRDAFNNAKRQLQDLHSDRFRQDS
jgi:hypothetical protein